eukprot:m.196323 g.196323  ORF g.196323 m.196323 type:complete len:147 (-) comp10629_c0_seq6:2898-3338(-)
MPGPCPRPFRISFSTTFPRRLASALVDLLWPPPSQLGIFFCACCGSNAARSTRFALRQIKSILKFIFPVPKDDSRRVCTFANKDDFISFRHHVYKQNGKDIDLSEIGPRFEMKPYMIRLGTADQVDADIEWVSRPFMNTAKKRRFL